MEHDQQQVKTKIPPEAVELYTHVTFTVRSAGVTPGRSEAFRHCGPQRGGDCPSVDA
jgi:hypothetical protein